MLLSQLAWKLGCAFTSGRSGAPSEFRAVENELTSLTKSITLLSEALDRDDSILARADEKTKDGLDEILECCRQVRGLIAAKASIGCGRWLKTA